MKFDFEEKDVAWLFSLTSAFYSRNEHRAFPECISVSSASNRFIRISMDPQQARSDASSTLLLVPRGLRLINVPFRFKDILTIFSGQARQISRQIPPRLSSPPFRERNSLKWGSETRGLVEPKDFVVVILAHYPELVMTVNGQDEPFRLNAVLKDLGIVLKTLGYAHGDESRRFYFVMDFDVDYEDINGVTRPVPRAAYPGTRTPVTPTREGILGILREASIGGGSGFVHFGGHCMYMPVGTSDEPDEEIRYTQTPNGSPTMEAFIVTTDGERLYGREFIESLGDGTDKRCGTTLTVSFDMCHASAFLARVVEMPYQYRGEGIQEPVPTTRSTNQLVVISASQPGQAAGTCNGCGAMTYFLTTALMSGQGRSAADVIKDIHSKCQSQPDKRLLQTPQITSRYQLKEEFWLLPPAHSRL